MYTDSQKWIINPSTDETLTYQIYEDNAGGLHMLIFRESLTSAALIGACLGIRPEDISTCITDLDMWETWEGLVDVGENSAELDEIREKCMLVAESRVESLGLVREICYGRMGEAAKQAFKSCSREIFGGCSVPPAYAEPILKDYVSGRVNKRYSTPCKVSGSSAKKSRLRFDGRALYSYDTQIATIDRNNYRLVIMGQRYSATTSRIQNALETLANRWNFRVYYLAPHLKIDKVFS